ncbi:MAG: translation initiation factor IF-2 subunit alpha [Candidatus Odinarchaeia archaeon]
MAVLRRKTPEEGDLVICTVDNITSHGAYVLLDEYDNTKGFVHISEIASRWIKNIRNFVRENQKIVAKVLRVNQTKNQIDLSIRRVTEQQKKSKIQEWKRAKNADSLLKLAADKIGETLETAYKEVGWKLEDKFGEVYYGLEQIKDKGIQVLKDLKIPEKWQKVIYEIVEAYVELANVKVSAIIELTCYEPEGVDAIKKALNDGLEHVKKIEEVKSRIYLSGSPKYILEIEAPDYKIAERVLNETAEIIVNSIKKCKGQGSWKKVK